MEKEMSELLVNLQEQLRKQKEDILEMTNEIHKFKSELDWWRTYGEFVSANFSNVDASACSYADGNEE